MQAGIFTISLDFELLWGIFDKVGHRYDPRYFANTRKVIPQMLDLFGQNQIGATWATVGMLFAENEDEWKAYQPEQLPSYRQNELSAYSWAEQYGIRPEVHFAPELVKQIIETPFQELGSHTFAHYYTLMRGQSPLQFRADLKASQRIAKEKFGVSLQSLVFPRNHVNELYLKICKEEGFLYARGNPKNWYWQETQHEDLSKKLVRSADCFFQVGSKSTYSQEEIQVYPQEPVIIPASRILRPFAPKSPLLNSQRLRRILSEMSDAAQNGSIYHLWWHPHNFGKDPDRAMKELNQIITHYLSLKDQYAMRSMTMASLGEEVLQSKNRMDLTL
ncbi:polysaccharide deacetylase family protein [Algoriphagus namhaensis]